MEAYSEQRLVKATAQGHLYDYIAEHYTEMTTYSLKEVLLAVLGVAYDLAGKHREEDELEQLITAELAEREFGLD